MKLNKCISTVASYSQKDFPQAGWGQMLPLVFTNTVVIKNYGAGGATTRSFVEAGHWKTICDQLKPDDYVFVQFGHNHDAQQTLLALNHWRDDKGADLGIGNASTGNPDWTFAANAGSYKTKRLCIFVHYK